MHMCWKKSDLRAWFSTRNSRIYLQTNIYKDVYNLENKLSGDWKDGLTLCIVVNYSR